MNGRRYVGEVVPEQIYVGSLFRNSNVNTALVHTGQPLFDRCCGHDLLALTPVFCVRRKCTLISMQCFFVFSFTFLPNFCSSRLRSPSLMGCRTTPRTSGRSPRVLYDSYERLRDIGSKYSQTSLKRGRPEASFGIAA